MEMAGRKLYFALCVFISVLWITESTKPCPPFEDIEPCGCTSDKLSTRIDCILVSELDEVKRAMLGLKGYNDLDIDFLRCRMKHVPSNLFKGLHVKRLSFTNCDLVSIGANVNAATPSFEGLDYSLEELSISFSFSEENGLKVLNFSNLDFLEQLQIEGNYITTLSNDWFENGPRNVRNLFIMTNSIRDLGDKVFASLTRVKNLWLTGNELSVVSRSMFPQPAVHLISLDLTDNKISHLPPDLFVDMPSLKEVVLENNQIQMLPETTWSRIWTQVTRMYLQGNPLNCDDKMKWLLTKRRPHVLKGTCVAPPDKKGQQLKYLIDDFNASDEI